MKRKALRKDFWVEIKKTYPRFLSIIVIVLLGVAFFSGIRATSPDMELSADQYYDNQNFMDFRIVGELGLTKEDVEAIKGLPQVKEARGEYSTDVLAKKKDTQLALRLNSITRNMNDISVIEGRLPKNSKECLVDQQLIESYQYKIGDTLTVYQEKGEDSSLESSNVLTNMEYEIVGYGTSSYYLSIERGTTNIGNGTLNGFVMVTEEVFDYEMYTQISVQTKDAKEMVSFSKEYEDYIKMVENSAEEISLKQSNLRYEEVVSQLETTLQEKEEKLRGHKKELEDGKNAILDGETKLAKAKQELDQNQRKLKEVKNTLKVSKEELRIGEQQLEEGKKLLDESKVKLDKGEETLIQGKEELDARYQEYIKSKQAFEKGIQVPGLTIEVLEAVRVELEAARSTLLEKQEVLEAEKQQYQEGIDKLQTESKTLQEGRKKLLKGEEECQQAVTKINEGKEKLDQEEIRLQEAKETFETKSKEAEEKIAEGEKKIQEGKDKILEIQVPKWHILNRNTVESYVEYSQDSQRIAAIGEVFPAIFFLVATLICLTTMTRMVEENRTQIGTLKALGYGKMQIATKYIMYALLATLIGSLLGLVIGQLLLPKVIINAYKMLYSNLPEILTPIHLNYSISSSFLAIFCTIGATVFACNKELKSGPAILMRPTPPKNGKRVFLEKIPFIWKRFNFSNKATIRNLIRYKRRFFMTVFGIGACMGLLLVGFGVKDSISAIGELQFGEIRLYDATITVKDDLTLEEKRQLQETLNQEEQIEKSMYVYEKTIDAIKGNKKRSGYFIVPENSSSLNDYVTLRERKTKTTYQLGDDGVILTEKLAKLLEVKEGDVITLGNKEERVEVTIDHVVENYFYHYIIMSPKLYEKLYGDMPNFSQLYTKNLPNSKSYQEELQNKLMKNECIEHVTFVSVIADRINDMLKSMDVVILVLVVSAGLLAFVVLYNLNNINVSERKRELATLKVLGFYNLEVSEYVLRENILLTLIGCVAGIVIGMVLHQFVIITAEIDLMMFGRTIKYASYLYSIGFTLLFSLFVNFAMHFKLQKIDMVESMKSVE